MPRVWEPSLMETLLRIMLGLYVFGAALNVVLLTAWAILRLRIRYLERL